ncbi:hypothetical protein LJC09_02805 [Desulfovibrio sp. OttesenSCG-928-F20]|nr:hypothetical protein [Desulfovibrio sp. OttesenSCG-928-M16]MDL2291012.1 hypothetical protein [Desulfovibrio sp. OttesenSCG-928-F20]
MNTTRHNDDKGRTPPSPALSEQQRRELWLYIAVSLVAVELLLAVGALLFSFITMPEGAGGKTLAFPWLSWGALALVTPALILLLVHSADVGLFRAPGGARSEQDWQKLLPERMQKFYRILKGAPVVVVLAAIVALGAALLTLDGAISALGRFGSALLPHLPVIIGGVAGLGAIIAIAAVWLNYRTRRLIAEYEFRREVLEKTGVIIVDKGSAALPPGGVGDVPYALVAGDEDAQKALPQGESDFSAAMQDSVAQGKGP